MQILGNETYIGKLRWKRKPLEKKLVEGGMTKRRVLNRDYTLYEGRHPAIISPEQFETAQRLRRDRCVAPRREGTELLDPLAGLLVCGYCGSRMERVSFPQKQNARPRYRCRHFSDCRCRSSTVEEVERAAMENLEPWFKRYADRRKVEEVKAREAEKSLTELRERVNSLMDQRDVICDLYERGKYSQRLFDHRMEKLEGEIENAQHKLQEQERAVLEKTDYKILTEQVLPAVSTLLDQRDRLTPEERNRLWKRAVSKVVYQREEKKGTFCVIPYPRVL